jgi:hypothetical protein
MQQTSPRVELDSPPELASTPSRDSLMIGQQQFKEPSAGTLNVPSRLAAIG